VNEVAHDRSLVTAEVVAEVAEPSSALGTCAYGVLARRAAPPACSAFVVEVTVRSTSIP